MTSTRVVNSSGDEIIAVIGLVQARDQSEKKEKMEDSFNHL